MKMMYVKLLAAVATVAVLSGLSDKASAQTNVDLNGPAIGINSGILGTNYSTQRQVTTPVPRNGAAITGVAGGLLAETFDWQTQEGVPWPTLQVLRNIRDYGNEPLFIVNMRGTGTHSTPYSVGGFTFNNTSVDMLSGLAAKWVRYTNFILPSLYAGTPVSGLPSTDQGILNQISNFGDPSNVLPAAGETAVPTVKYWIIGNEPEISVGGKKFTNRWNELPPWNNNNWSTTEYVNRYKTITAAMKAVDPTIKVGPGMLGSVDMTVAPLLQSTATIDFWAYHSYGSIQSATTTSQREAALRNVRANQINTYNAQRNAFTAAGRDPNSVEYMVTEWNPADPNNDPGGNVAKTMYQGLAFADTVFTFAGLGITKANYWGLMQNDDGYHGWVWPMASAWEALNQNMGDTLVKSIVDDANNRRVYVTKDSQTGKVVVWGLNFSNSNDTSIALSLNGMEIAPDAIYSVLSGGANGTLLSFNDKTDPNGWDTVIWRDQSLTNFNAANFNFSIPHASIVMLELQAVPEPAMLGLIGISSSALLLRRNRKGDMH